MKPEQIGATKYGNRYGVPCLFPADLVSTLLECSGDRAAGPLLNGKQTPVIGLDARGLERDVDHWDALIENMENNAGKDDLD